LHREVTLYRAIVRPLLFRLDAETAHRLVLRQLRILPAPLLRAVFGGPRRHGSRTVFGVDFPNPVGLAAGMDKNGVALRGWEALGFGFVELGTITAKPQPGNPRPRLFRFPAQQAIVNRMGFNNDGAGAVAARCRRMRHTGDWPSIPVGINIGKSGTTPLDQAKDDYLFSFRALREFGDYFVINVSSPNTPGLRDLQEISRLREIIRVVASESGGKPLLVKIAPDLPDQQAVEIAASCEREGIAGLIATNTTLDHSALPKEINEQGGLSGRPLASRSTELIKLLRSACSLQIVGSGGVMDAASAKEKFDAGARLIQIYSGLIYRGPRLIREIASSQSQNPPRAIT
jgi:dihydroorotate dehydrogenase